MLKKTGIIVLLVIVVIATLLFSGQTLSPKGLENYKGMNAVIGGANYQLYVADTETKKEQGLSGLNGLPQNSGMLFIFDDLGYYQFWMKDMKFPIDIIFLNNDKITAIHENVLPNSYPKTFTSPQPSNRVIELASGSAAKLELHIGDVITLR